MELTLDPLGSTLNEMQARIDDMRSQRTAKLTDLNYYNRRLNGLREKKDFLLDSGRLAHEGNIHAH